MTRLQGCVCAFSLLALSPAVHGSLVASDSQADPAYATWDPGDNGGTGWSAGWTFRDQANAVVAATNGSHGWFVASSTGNDNVAGDTNGDGDINSPSTGKAWGLYSNAVNNDIYAVRPFTGALSVGQTLKFDMDNGNIATSQVVGVRLLSNASDIASRVFEFRFVGGDSFYTTIGSPNQTSTVGFTREGLHLEYTLTAATAWSLKIVRLVDGSTTTMTGTNANSNSIVALAFKNQQAGTGVNADAYFNNIAITPEPGSFFLLGASGLLLAARRRRV